MPEQLTATPEVTSALRPEPIDSAIERLSAHLQVVPGDTATVEDIPKISYMGTKDFKGEGEYNWMRSFIPEPIGNFVKVDLATHPEDAPVFQYAADNLKQDTATLRSLAHNEGRWWMSSKAEAAVETNLRQAFRVHDGDRQLDILNCGPEDLVETEQASIVNVFNAVANYTGNKIFDRLAGVVLLPGSEFDNDIAGDYQPASGVVRINLDSLHEEKALGRYRKYFPADTDATWFEVVLAHELGHSMDIASLDEAEAHSINKDSYWWQAMGNHTHDFSAFDSKFGWTHSIQTKVLENGSKSKTTIHHMDDAQEIECRENAPTWYARTDPHEDFAETFAIAALGGDLSSIPGRHEAIVQAIHHAEGESLYGPKKVTLEAITTADQLIRPIDKLALDVFIAV